MLKTTSRVVLIGLLALMILSGSSTYVVAQQQEIPKDPLQVVDVSTGKMIPEVLVLPRHSRFKGVSTMLGHGPGTGTYVDYLAKPFVYRPGDRFRLKLPKSTGLALVGLLFVGKGRSLEGVLLVAPGYRPLWFIDLWKVGLERKVKLRPISDDEWSLLLDNKLSHFEKDVTRIEDDCYFWDLPSPCSLDIHYNKKERALVRSFLQRPRSETK